jgi:hypothetical protein
MRYLIILAILFFASACYGQQCPTGLVCFTQERANQISKDLTELANARDAIAKFTNERALTEAERQAAQVLQKSLRDAFDARGKIIADQQSIIDIQAKALTLYSQLVEKLQARVDKPKSSFQKFMDALKDIAYIATGVVIGRHF